MKAILYCKTSTPSINHDRRLRAEEEERARREEEEEMARSALENANPDLVRWDDNEDDRDVCGTVPIRERCVYDLHMQIM